MQQGQVFELKKRAVDGGAVWAYRAGFANSISLQIKTIDVTDQVLEPHGIVRGDVRRSTSPTDRSTRSCAWRPPVTSASTSRTRTGSSATFTGSRPSGHVGFSDLDLRACPSQQENHALRAVLYHSGAELVTDWPALFLRHGFTIVDRGDIIADTIETWDRVRAVYEQRGVEAVHRYGNRLARRIRARIDSIPEILAKYATFPVLSALK
jgi:hypothetical protein